MSVALYMPRKLAGLCVHCGAGLPEDGESVVCVECRELQRQWRQTRKGRKIRALQCKRARIRKRASGTCYDCATPALPGRVRCAWCTENMRLSKWKAKERRKAA